MNEHLVFVVGSWLHPLCLAGVPSNSGEASAPQQNSPANPHSFWQNLRFTSTTSRVVPSYSVSRCFFFWGGFLALRKTQLWNQRLVFFAPTDEGTVCCAGPWDDLRTFDYYPIIIRVLYNIWLSTRTGRYLYILVYFDISYDILFVWNKLVSFTGFQSKTPVVTWSIHLPLVATKQLDLLSPSLEELLKMVGLVMECHVYWTIHGKYGIRSIDHLSYLWIIEIYLRTLFYFIYFWFMEIFGNANAIILI